MMDENEHWPPHISAAELRRRAVHNREWCKIPGLSAVIIRRVMREADIYERDAERKDRGE